MSAILTPSRIALSMSTPALIRFKSNQHVETRLVLEIHLEARHKLLCRVDGPLSVGLRLLLSPL
eukprot:2723668-Prymnesium_polylepis.1